VLDQPILREKGNGNQLKDNTNRAQQLCCMCPAAYPFFSFPFQRNLDQTPTTCALLGREREGRGRGKVEQLKSWEKKRA